MQNDAPCEKPIVPSDKVVYPELAFTAWEQ